MRSLSILDVRCIGLEQELFLVDARGVLVDRADEFLPRCWEAAEAAGMDPGGFAQECSGCIVEINTPPAYSLAGLSREYLMRLELALEAGRELGLRLYPLATYPLDVDIDIRDEPGYRIQARAVGPVRFEHAGRCAGVHLHLEVSPGTVDARVGASYGVSGAAREELLNIYNLATALDPALIALTRSSPYYAGIADGMSARTAHYRGDCELAPYGIYAFLGEVGSLRPYANSVEELVELQFARYHAWLHELDRAGVDRGLFFEAGGGLLKASSWNPVRLNPLGTVELRGIDGNYPETILATVGLISTAAERVRREGLAVLPCEEVRGFEVEAASLLVPGFAYLNGDLFRAALTDGIESGAIVSYLDSVLGFAGAGEDAATTGFEVLKPDGRYRTTEADIYRRFASSSPVLPEDLGLRLVREACDELEEQVAALRHEKTTRAGANGD